MQPRRVREGDTARLNALELKVAGIESSFVDKTKRKTVVPHAYSMTSYVDGVFGKFVVSVSGTIKSGLLFCELGDGSGVPKVSINIKNKNEVSGVDVTLINGLNEVKFSSGIKVGVGDIVIVESPTPERIKTLALSFNVEI